MNNDILKIVSCSITEYPRPKPAGLFDPMPQVWVKLENGDEQMLFEFFPDEINFTEKEFVGLTIGESYQLRQKKDISYIQS